MSIADDRHKIPPEGTTFRAGKPKAAPLDALEAPLRWGPKGWEQRLKIGKASCLRFGCRADAITFKFGDAIAVCAVCGDRYANLGGRVRRIEPSVVPENGKTP